MIVALRKIEGRGDLSGANSAIMEMCVDNPREDAANLFDTHPPIKKRIEALIKFAGGHDPGPIALPKAGEREEQETSRVPEPGSVNSTEPFLPPRPPIELGVDPPLRAQPPDAVSSPEAGSESCGPWGARRQD